jgi:hypothetical protein
MSKVVFIAIACFSVRYVLSLSQSDSVLIYSDSTPTSLINELSEFRNKVYINSQNYNCVIKKLEDLDFIVIVDITLQTSYYTLLENIASSFRTPYFSLSSASDYEFYSDWRYNLHSSYINESKAILSMLSYLNLTKIVLMSSSDHKGIEISDYIYQNSSNIIHSYLKYEYNLTQSVSDSIAGKIIKAGGIRQILIIDYGDSLNKVEAGITGKRITTAGTIILMSARSVYSATIQGSLIVAESGTENSTSYETYEHSIINKTFEDINAFIAKSGISSVNKHNLDWIIGQIYPSHVTTTFNLVNVQTAGKVVIGSIKDDFYPINPIYYPGNTTYAGASELIKLTFSIANGTSEPYNASQYTVFVNYYKGASYAVQQINANQEIPGFEIDLFPTNCGDLVYDQIWYYKCFSSIAEKMGIANIAPFWETAAFGDLVTLMELGLYLPQVSPLAQSDIVNNSTKFPMFLKLSVSASQFFSTGIFYGIALGWTNLVVLATDDPNYYHQYLELVQYTSAAGMKIVNPVDKRILPYNYTRNNFNDYRSYFQAAKDTNCRLYCIVAIDRGLIIEGLYDVGMRRGDLIEITESATISYLHGVPEEYLHKREELLYGSFVIAYREWIGTLGTELKEYFSKIYYDTSYQCMTYDTVSVIKEALIYVIDKGDDYEDGVLLSKVMRNNIITGCVGPIYFDTDGNSRAYARFIMQQLLKNETNGQWYFYNIAYLDKLASQIIVPVAQPIWPTGGSTIPPNFRPKNLCPFDSYETIRSDQGKLMMYIICSIFLLISIVSSIFSYGRYKSAFRMLSKKKLVSFSDLIFLSYFLFQFIQLIAIGPKQDSLTFLFNNAEVLFSFNFVNFFQLDFYSYWVLYYSLLAFSFVLSLICLIFMARYSFLGDRTQLLSELFMPVLGHIGFLPITVMLLTIYNCNYGISESLQDSFSDRDCTVFCYRSGHLPYIIISSIIIALYVFTATYCRPLWEKTQSCLHFETKRIYLSLLSVFQIQIVMLEKTLKVYNETLYGIVLCIDILIFFAFTVYIQPYNCRRAVVMQCCSLILSCWGIFTSVVFRNMNDVTTWIYVEFAGFFLILGVGLLILSRFPLFVYSDQSVSISSLFLYQCFKKYETMVTEEISRTMTIQRKYSMKSQKINPSRTT